MQYFFPQTSANIGAYTWSLEQHGVFNEWVGVDELERAFRVKVNRDESQVKKTRA
jgi:hypothetical protein